jgi:hypothetical protein
MGIRFLLELWACFHELNVIAVKKDSVKFDHL